MNLKTVSKVGSITAVNSCKMPLMKEVKSCNGSKKFHPHEVFCFINLVSALQTLILRVVFWIGVNLQETHFRKQGFRMFMVGEFGRLSCQ